MSERRGPITAFREGIADRRLKVGMYTSGKKGYEFCITTKTSAHTSEAQEHENTLGKRHFKSFRSVEFRTRLGAAARTGIAATVLSAGVYSGIHVGDDINQLRINELGDGLTGEGFILAAIYARTSLRNARRALAERRAVRHTKRAARSLLDDDVSTGEKSTLSHDYPAAKAVAAILGEFDDSEQ